MLQNFKLIVVSLIPLAAAGALAGGKTKPKIQSKFTRESVMASLYAASGSIKENREGVPFGNVFKTVDPGGPYSLADLMANFSIAYSKGLDLECAPTPENPHVEACVLTFVGQYNHDFGNVMFEIAGSASRRPLIIKNSVETWEKY